jgi:beta-lactamase superfamily II metal-dependent hydrolase
MNVFAIEMLPAAEGDALWIEYGDKDDPYRVLIDGGVWATHRHIKRQLKAIAGERRFELVVVTHVDNDHIDGLAKLLANDQKLDLDDLWFNSWDQLKAVDALGEKQGEILSYHIEQWGLPHNRRIDGQAIGLPQDEDESLPCFEFAGDLKITVVGPPYDDLKRLRREWKKTIEELKLRPGDKRTAEKLIEDQKKYQPDRLGGVPNLKTWAARKFKDDGSVPNASSISLLVEYGGRTFLFTGDATSASLVDGLDRLRKERGVARIKLDAMKVPHHGSKNNVSTEVMKRISCDKFLFSTNGNKFDHPDDDAVARIIVGSTKPSLYFNYFSEDSKKWASELWQTKHKYSAVYPKEIADGKYDEGLRVEFPINGD